LYPGDSGPSGSRNQPNIASVPSTTLNQATAQFGRPLNTNVGSLNPPRSAGVDYCNILDNMSGGKPGTSNQQTAAHGSWNQSSVPGSYNQPSGGPPENWNQPPGGPPGNWNQPSGGPPGNWNQPSGGPPGNWNQPSGCPPGNWNQPSGGPPGNWNLPGFSSSAPPQMNIVVPDPQKIVELQNYIKRQESSKQLNNYRINI